MGQGVSDRRQVDVGAVAGDPVREGLSLCGNAFGGLARDDQRVDPGFRSGRDGGRFRRHLGGLLEYDVRVGAADTEGRHPGTAWSPGLRPLLWFGGDGETRGAVARVRIQRREVELTRDVRMLDRQHRLDETGDTGGGFEVP